jgi:hypothetical protein
MTSEIQFYNTDQDFFDSNIKANNAKLSSKFL